MLYTQKNISQIDTGTNNDNNKQWMNLTIPNKDIKLIDTKLKMKQLLKDKHSQITTPGIFVNAFDIQQSDWDKSSDFTTLMQDYTNMRNGDPFVSSSVDVLLNPIINAQVKVNPCAMNEEDKPSDIAEEAKNYIQWIFNNLYNGLQSFHKHLMLAFYYGMALFEMVWIKGDDYNGKITNRLAKLSPIQLDTIQRFYYDDITEFMGLRLWRRIPNQGSRWIDIMAEQMHRFTPFEEFNNVEGRSIIRPIRFTWNIKQQLLKSQARAASRGAGIPVVKLAKGITDGATVLGNTAKTIVQTVGNSENCGVIEQEGVFEFRLEGLKSQENNMALLDFCNSEIVYNTLTQFLISGIGGNGSRSATDSHKSSYQDALNCDIVLVEQNYNELVRIIIENSYLFGSLDKKEYPYITLDRPKDVDLTQTADNWIKLVQSSGVTPTKEDEKYFRRVFGLPELSEQEIKEETTGTLSIPDFFDKTGKNKKEDTETIEEKDEKDENDIKENPKMDTRKTGNTDILVKLENQKRSLKYNNVMEIKHGIDFLNKQEPEVQKIIAKHYQAMIDYAKHQLKKDINKPIQIIPALRESLYKELNSYWNDAYNKGYEISRKEIKKIDNEVKLENAKGPLKLSKAKNKLEYIIRLFGDNIENQINTGMLNTNAKTVEIKGGIDNYVENIFGDSQKTVQATLLNNTMSGYIEGRHDAQGDYESETGNKLAKTYTLQLERQNVCENCFPYEGIVFTQNEAEGLGLNWEGSPLNPECLGLLGKNQCQCSWIPEEIINE